MTVTKRGEDWSAHYDANQPLPISGEQVQGLPSSRSPYAKAPKKLVTGTPEHQVTKEARKERANWERRGEGKARTRDISQSMAETHGIHATTGQIYDDLRRSGAIARQSGPTAYDVQLPGMADPHAAPRPPRWEELSPETQGHVHRALAAQGTSIEKMTSDFGAQHDQAIERAVSHGHDRPYASTFYSTGEPRQVIRKSAAEIGLPQLIHAQINAFTSPNTKFAHTLKTGETTYPNDMAAKHAALHAMRGGDPAELRTNPSAREMRQTGLVGAKDTRRVQGYPANLEKAAQAVHQHLAGIHPPEWKTGQGAGPLGEQEGASPWRLSPKTGPYANSWSDTHPQFFVADIHSGGGGMLPHQSSYKGMGEGRVKGQKSEREAGIEKTPFFHSAADYASRQAMKARGLSSVRETQAGQWGEEQLQRREEATAKGWSTAHYPAEETAYPARKKREVHGQESLF